MILQCLMNSRYKQFLVAVVTSLLFSGMTVFTNWSSPTLPKLTTDPSYAGITITSNEASWIISSQAIGVCGGSCLAAWLLNKIGRKKSLLLGSLLMLLPWIAISFPANAIMMAVAFAVGGLGGAFAVMVIPIYAAEVIDKDVRGQLSSVIILVSSIGAVLTMAAGPFLSYKAVNALCASFPLVFMCSFLFMPESPYYLIMIGNEEHARKSLNWLNNDIVSENLDRKLEDVKQAVQRDMENKVTIKDLFLQINYRKSIGFVMGLRTLVQLCGILPISSYLQTILDLTPTSISSSWISVIFGVLPVPASMQSTASACNTIFKLLAFLSIFLVDRVGRKPLLVVSSVGSFIVLASLGAFYYLHEETNVNLDNVTFLPALFLCLFAFVVSIAVQSLPYVIFGELLAINIKNIGGLLFTFYGAVLKFIVIKAFYPISDAYGMYTMIWFFAGFCFLGTLFSIFILPETKNKSLAEIQKELRGE